MTIKFTPNDKGNPPGKLADAELHFSGGPLDGLKLVGFAVWERKTGGRNVTFPARQYSVNGERRSFSLLRPIVDSSSQDKLRDLVLDASRTRGRTAAASCLRGERQSRRPFSNSFEKCRLHAAAMIRRQEVVAAAIAVEVGVRVDAVSATAARQVPLRSASSIASATCGRRATAGPGNTNAVPT